MMITPLTILPLKKLMTPIGMSTIPVKFSPVAILISVYAGVIYYGIGGVILGPVTLLILIIAGAVGYRNPIHQLEVTMLDGSGRRVYHDSTLLHAIPHYNNSSSQSMMQIRRCRRPLRSHPRK